MRTISFISINTVDVFLTVVCLDTGECMLTLEGSNKKLKKFMHSMYQLIVGHTGLVRSLHFDKDEIVSGSYDQSIRVWDIHTGKCIKTYSRCHTSWVFDVMFDETKIIR